MSGYVYILQSDRNQRYYIGFTHNVETRLIYHNSGKVTATRNKGPWVIKYLQEYPDEIMAKRVEYKLKQLKNKTIIDRIIAEQKILITA